MKSGCILFALLLTTSCGQVQETAPVSPPSSDTANALPAHIEKAIQVLFSDGGQHPSPMPGDVQKAFDTLHQYDTPQEGIGKTMVDGSYSKTHYYPKSRIQYRFHSSAEGVESITFTRGTEYAPYGGVSQGKQDGPTSH